MMIDEQGLQLEKQKASLRVKESKREHLSEVIDLVIDPTVRYYGLSAIDSIITCVFCE